MAELTINPSPPLSGSHAYRVRTSTQQFRIIAWLRWRIFINSMRGKGAQGELVVRLLSYPFVAFMVLGPAVGAGFGSWYFVQRGQVSYLAIPLWIIFGLWQFIGVSTSTTGPSFDLSTLARFPLRYRDYFLIRLAFGLLDIPTLSGTACLIAMCVGVGVAAPALLSATALTLFLYAISNILFSRMVYSWFERWMAQRRTRELVTVLILVLSLGIQFGSQFLERLTTTRHHHGVSSPLMLKASHALVAVNWLLPPGLAASTIERVHVKAFITSIEEIGGLLIYCAAFLLILHLRIHAQYLGENLSEAPSSTLAKGRARISKTILSASPQFPQILTRSAGETSLLSPTVSACFRREIRYLLRSGPKLYALVMPVFMILLFSFRTAGLDSVGFSHGTRSYLFTYGCAYAQLILVSLLYNSLGSDAAGIQFYFIAPVRFRDVMLAKNLMTGVILIIEVVLMYIVSAFLAKPAPPALAAATLAWMVFTLLVNMSIGNVRSLVSPKVIEASRVRRQNISGMNSVISLGVVLISGALGSCMQFVCATFGISYWIAALFFLVLTAIALVAYLTALQRLDKIAEDHRDDLIRELCKS